MEDPPWKCFHFMHLNLMNNSFPAFYLFFIKSTSSSWCDEIYPGAGYLQEFAKFLTTEFKNKSMKDIFGMAKNVMKVKILFKLFLSMQLINWEHLTVFSGLAFTHILMILIDKWLFRLVIELNKTLQVHFGRYKLLTFLFHERKSQQHLQ